MDFTKKLITRAYTAIVLLGAFSTFTSCSNDDGIDGINGTPGEDGNDFTNTEESLIPLITSITPNFLQLTNDFSKVSITPILTSEDVLESTPEFVYGSMADGNGLLAENDGTFTLINNIEADYSIARIKLNKNLQPVHGEYILNSFATANTAQCSGSMITPYEHGFGPLFLSGGEWGGSSKGVFATDPYKSTDNASTAIMLPTLGQWSTENAVAIGKDAFPGNTLVFIGDDHSDNSTPSGQLGLYIGSTGDLSNGNLYGLKVSSEEIVYEVDMKEGTSYEAEFIQLEETDIDLLDAEAKEKGVMGFSRLEDIDWRRGSEKNQRELYFAVTGREQNDLIGKGTIKGRVYKVVLHEEMLINSSENYLKATITCVLDGDKENGIATSFHSPDNILVTENFVYIQEDPNGISTVADGVYAKLYQYNIVNNTLKTVLECDQETAAAAGYGSADTMWELTGITDVTDIVNSGTNTFLLISQNHGWEPADGSSFTDPNANSAVDDSRAEGSMLYAIKGLDR